MAAWLPSTEIAFCTASAVLPGCGGAVVGFAGVLAFGHFLRLQTDQQVAAAAEALHLGTGITGAFQVVAHGIDVSRLVEADFDHGAAGEVQGVVEALEGNAADGGNEHQRRQANGHPAGAHEVELGVVRDQMQREKFHGFYSLPVRWPGS